MPYALVGSADSSSGIPLPLGRSRLSAGLMRWQLCSLAQSCAFPTAGGIDICGPVNVRLPGTARDMVTPVHSEETESVRLVPRLETNISDEIPSKRHDRSQCIPLVRWLASHRSARQEAICNR
jgi:hypothetical protein